MWSGGPSPLKLHGCGTTVAAGWALACSGEARPPDERATEPNARGAQGGRRDERQDDIAGRSQRKLRVPQLSWPASKRQFTDQNREVRDTSGEQDNPQQHAARREATQKARQRTDHGRHREDSDSATRARQPEQKGRGTESAATQRGEAGKTATEEQPERQRATRPENDQ